MEGEILRGCRRKPFNSLFRAKRIISPYLKYLEKIHSSHMRITVRVIPRSGKNVLEWDEGNEREGDLRGQQGILKARLTAPPVDGAANEALVALLADRLHLPKRAIQIVRGATSRLKTVEIDGLTLDELRSRLQ